MSVCVCAVQLQIRLVQIRKLQPRWWGADWKRTVSFDCTCPTKARVYSRKESEKRQTVDLNWYHNEREKKWMSCHDANLKVRVKKTRFVVKRGPQLDDGESTATNSNCSVPCLLLPSLQSPKLMVVGCEKSGARTLKEKENQWTADAVMNVQRSVMIWSTMGHTR